MRPVFLRLAVLAAVTPGYAQDVSSPSGDNPAKTTDKETAAYFEPGAPIKVTVQQQFAVIVK